MSKLLRGAFFLLIVRPVLTLMLGTHVRGRENLPVKGPAIIVANHNSHLDTMTIMAMFPMRYLPKLRPVAAMDYFMRNGPMAWFATNIIGIIPIVRGGHAAGANPLAPCEEALDRGEILIIFPEGSRGEPEKLQQFKKGVAHLAKARPGTPVHPLFMHGLGKALPKDIDPDRAVQLRRRGGRAVHLERQHRELHGNAADAHGGAGRPDSTSCHGTDLVSPVPRCGAWRKRRCSSSCRMCCSPLSSMRFGLRRGLRACGRCCGVRVGGGHRHVVCGRTAIPASARHVMLLVPAIGPDLLARAAREIARAGRCISSPAP